MSGPGKAKLISKKTLTNDTIELSFEVLSDFEYLAGQFINIKIDDDKGFPCFRAYSISGFENGIMELCVKIIKNGRGSVFMNSLKEGEEITFIGPTGKFVYAGENAAIFIATGSGIAPIKAIISEEAKNPDNKLTLLFGLRFEEDIYYKEFFENLKKSHSNFDFILTLSRPSEAWSGKRGRVTQFLNEKELPHFKESAFYICGNPEMVQDTEKTLLENGIIPEKIHTEKY
ncbi:MAG: FAD-dependent oxidoreductase [Candidatus Gracilibacteria bacterium]|jgi:NAD(P)H-flavin reductase|nr:FAD-dependent oxidoreductase [Candidatus Gracilibacteria bacterium]